MRVFLGLGSNISPRKTFIEAALRHLGKMPSSSITKVSSLYETSPVGGPRQDSFLNAVAQIETKLSPQVLLRATRLIEKNLKRRKRIKWGPRTIDLDILLYGNQRLSRPMLKIPHPHFHERRFVLIPLAEIAPRVRHPLKKASAKSLLRRLTPLGQRVTMVGTWKRSHFVLSKRKKSKKPR